MTEPKCNDFSRCDSCGAYSDLYGCIGESYTPLVVPIDANPTAFKPACKTCVSWYGNCGPCGKSIPFKCHPPEREYYQLNVSLPLLPEKMMMTYQEITNIIFSKQGKWIGEFDFNRQIDLVASEQNIYTCNRIRQVLLDIRTVPNYEQQNKAILKLIAELGEEK